MQHGDSSSCHVSIQRVRQRAIADRKRSNEEDRPEEQPEKEISHFFTPSVFNSCAIRIRRDAHA